MEASTYSIATQMRTEYRSWQRGLLINVSEDKEALFKEYQQHQSVLNDTGDVCSNVIAKDEFSFVSKYSQLAS